MIVYVNIGESKRNNCYLTNSYYNVRLTVIITIYFII